LEFFMMAERDEATSSMQVFFVHYPRGEDESTLYEGLVSKVMIDPAPTRPREPRLLAVSFVGEGRRVVTVMMDPVAAHKLSGRLRAVADKMIVGG
jgi:hypothetical protein